MNHLVNLILQQQLRPIIIWKITVIVCTLTILIACSSEEHNDEKKSEIHKATDKVARELVEDIQKPLDKAKAVKTLEEQRNDTIGDQAQ